MRPLRIFFLYLQQVFEQKSRSLVWFLIPILNALLMILFWSGAANLENWSIESLATYYLLGVIAGSLLISHIEEDVARRDIQEGQLVKYITKPFNYFWFKFFEELPWRVLQGFFGLAVFVVALLFFKNTFELSVRLESLPIVLITMTLSYFLSFVFKMLLGFTSFWITDIWGIQDFQEILTSIFAGFLVPLSLLPDLFAKIANILPFSYMVYYPMIVFMGKTTNLENLRIIIIQLLWLFCFIVLYKLVWKKGLEKFTGVGQ